MVPDIAPIARVNALIERSSGYDP